MSDWICVLGLVFTVALAIYTGSRAAGELKAGFWGNVSGLEFLRLGAAWVSARVRQRLGAGDECAPAADSCVVLVAGLLALPFFCSL